MQKTIKADLENGNIVVEAQLGEEGKGKVKVEIEVPLISILEKAAEATPTKVDDAVVEKLKALLSKYEAIV